MTTSTRDDRREPSSRVDATTVLQAERVLTPGRILAPGWVTIAGDRIVEVSDRAPTHQQAIELAGHDLLPGLIDLHSDCWHHRARPRASTVFPLDDTLVMVDTELASWGVTTNFLCVAVQDDSGKGRTLDGARDSVAIAQRLRPQLRIDHRVHLRVEATTERTDVADELAGHDVVGLLSYMDHTPGQGQFRHEDDWRRYYASTGETDLDGLLARRRDRQAATDEVRAEVAALAARHHLVLASHDDDSPQRVTQAHDLGARIAEFPVTAQAARTAREQGLLTVMGAPNAVRGTSHLDGNLAARDALQAGLLGALASDYHPPSLLGAIYTLARNGSATLLGALTLATSGPADAVGLPDRGRLVAGARADLIAVTQRAGRPTVTASWVAGRPVFGPPSPASSPR